MGKAFREAYEAAISARAQGWRLSFGPEGARAAARELMESVTFGAAPSASSARSNFIRIASMCLLCAACLEEFAEASCARQPGLPGL